MDATTLLRLRAADDARHTDYPPDFDWQKAMERVHNLRPMLEAIVGRSLSLNDQVQDATYFADLRVLEPPKENGFTYMRVTFSILFSCFASLVTIYNEGVFTEDKVGQLRTALEDQGFIFVDAEQLREPYTGSHAGFNGHTWMDRFFNYT